MERDRVKRNQEKKGIVLRYASVSKAAIVMDQSESMVRGRKKKKEKCKESYVLRQM